MPKVQTNDADKRAQFKASLTEKVALSLTPPKRETHIVEPVQVSIPFNFHTLSKVELFGYLTHEKALTSDQANDVVDILTEGISNQYYEINLEGVFHNTGSETTIQEAPPELREVHVELPHNFDNLRIENRFLWLMKESQLGLSYAEANDVIDILSGRSQVTDTVFTLTYAEEPEFKITEKTPTLIPTKRMPTFELVDLPDEFFTLTSVDQYRYLTIDQALTPEHSRFVLDSLEVEPLIQSEPAKEETPIKITLPLALQNWTLSDQFSYLTKASHLDANSANEVLASLSGKASNPPVEVTWAETVSDPGRLSLKYALTERVRASKVKDPPSTTPVPADRKAHV